MKRWISIVSSLVVVFSGFYLVLAVCKDVSEASRERGYLSYSHSSDEHHSHSGHEHSDGSLVHCPLLDQVFFIGEFRTNRVRGSQHYANLLVAESTFPMVEGEVHRLIHGPPAFAGTSGIPFHLFLSMLLI